ncbi:MAG: PAS domain S-box protein [Chloroflexota bacterium]
MHKRTHFTVLFVEDNPGNVRLVREALKEAPGDYRLLEAGSLSAALDVAGREHIDAVLLDLGLPDSEGPDTLKRLLAGAGNLPVVVLTEVSDEDLGLALLRDGAQDYLPKAEITGQQVGRAIRHAVERKRLTDALSAREEQYRSLVDNAAEMIVVIQDGVVKYANPRAFEISEYWRAEVLNRSFLDFIHPDDRQMVAERHQKRVAGEDVRFRYEFRLTQRSGQTRWVAASATRIEWEGKPATLNLLTDVTERRRAEQEAWESEERYRALMELSGEVGEAVVVASDRQGKEALQVFFNRTWPCMTGYTPDELYGMSFFDLVAPRDRQASLERHRRRMRGESLPGLFEMSVLRKDGTEVPVELTSAFTTYQGQMANVAYIRDVTERRHAEERLREAEARYRTLFQSAADAIVVYDLEGNIVDVNDVACSRLGYGREELLRMRLQDIDAPEEAEKMPERIEKLREQGFLYTQNVGVARDGTRFNTEVNARFIEYGGRGLVLGVIRDITQRKRMETALRQTEQEFRALFEQVGDAVYVATPGGTIKRVNPAAADLFGYARQEFEGMDVRKLYADPHERPGVIEQIERQGRLVDFDVRMKRKDGEVMDCQVTSAVLSSPTDASHHYLTVVRDVTERKRMQEQLMLADRLASVGELVSGVAHELNNPLTAVMGFAELLTERDLPEDVKEDVATIKREGDRAVKIVRDLLTFARKHPPSKQSVNVNRVIEDVLALRAYEHRVHDIEVVRELAPDLPGVMADYHQLQQVFVNLVVNAEHFMLEAHGRGTLTVRTEKTDGNVRASVADDGPGIAREALGRVFDPFFTTREVGKGTGLGLSISHGIVMEHGGRIWVESEQGKGATFVVELPAQAGEVSDEMGEEHRAR